MELKKAILFLLILIAPVLIASTWTSISPWLKSGTTVSLQVATDTVQVGSLTASKPVITDASKNLTSGSQGNLSEVTSAVLTISGGTSAVWGTGTTIQVLLASGAQSGYLSSGDWTTFNSKQPAGNYITALTSDVTATGPGSVAATIASGVVTLAKMANLAANSIIGNNTALPATPLALTVSQTKTLLSLDLVENTTLSTWAGTTNITILGTIATGSWNATAIPWAKVDKTGSNLTDIATRAHSSLTGLTNDDHTQYALLAGRAGGQTLTGGTAASETLTLNSTAHATKGKIVFSSSPSSYDQATNTLFITSAGTALDVQGFATVVSLTETSSATNSTRNVFRALAVSTGDMIDGFGPQFIFAIKDNAGVSNNIGVFNFIRDGADNNGKFQIQTYNAGTGNANFTIDHLGNIGIVGQLTSTLAIGTAPFVITSTTKVSNLNADAVDDLHAQTLTPSSPITLSGATSVLAAAGITISHATTAGNIHLPTGGATGQIITYGAASGTGAWTTATYPATTTAYRMLVSTGTSAIGELAAVGATGEYLAGATGAIPAWATLNQAAVAGLTTASSPVFVTVKCSALTDGYLPYHVSDASGLANSVIYTDGTRVSIGTASPLSALNDTLTVIGTGIFQTTSVGSYNENLRLNRNSNNNYVSLILGGAYNSTSGTGVGQWSLYTYPNSGVNPYGLQLDYNVTQVIAITTGGNVGIGMTPTYTLDITGNLRASTGFGCNGTIPQTAYASGGALAAYATGVFGLDSGANMAALHALVVKIRAALVANGIMS